jgi:threonine dehydrogenase-like Zn-dependent dehydrogenase
MSTKLDALVVGAGPVGLSMAAALLAQGLQVRIIDSAADRAQESRAIAKPIFELIQKHYGQIITPYVVLPNDGPATELGVDLLIDVEAQFAQHYAASVLYLVRPDGYIAFRCLAAKQSLLQSYIDKCFVPL